MAPGPGPIALVVPSSDALTKGLSGKDRRIDVDEGDEEANDTEIEILQLRSFLTQSEGSALRAWLKHFDTNNDQKITLQEFFRGMRKLNFQGDITALFGILDKDMSGELSLEEIDAAQAGQWRRFRSWCVSSFESKEDMQTKLWGASRVGAPASEDAPDGTMCLADFTVAIRNLGWTEQNEELLFGSIDVDGNGYIVDLELKWLELEKKRQWEKQQARALCLQESKKRERAWKQAEQTLEDFKHFLKHKYGHYVRAWRRGLSPDGNMVLQKNDLFKAVTNLGWEGDVRLLYKGFDRDESGFICIEELDAKSAEMVARFKVFIDEKFGSASAAFRAFDRHNKHKILEADFVRALVDSGYEGNTKIMFHGLDWYGNKALVEEDLLFLDKFKPRPFLLSQPNEQSAEEVKAMLLKKYKTWLKAWRHALDTDSSNRCNYDEFEEACKKIGYHGDVPGAWRHLDREWSGVITLREIDTQSSEVLKSFKVWCETEFGSVRSAFGVFDATGDQDVTYREFRRSCRTYGFEGQTHALFHALDVEGSGALQMEEVIFLDEWEFMDEHLSDESKASQDFSLSPLQPTLRPTNFTEFYTEGRGPGAYHEQRMMGAGPMVPGVRFGGSYSFMKRRALQLPGLNRDSANMPSPGDYDDRRGFDLVNPGHPAWNFGKERRQCVEVPTVAPFRPGPGQYSPAKHQGPAAFCTPRRPLRVHPLINVGRAQLQPGALFSPGRLPPGRPGASSGLSLV
mmetsp:Transcript_165702/g.532002  ORF Transcript_165702/g.532002 Transcript_165702/m.532002 type:complete len:740 (-) Transcript_165702:27-2246(-)